MFKHLINWWKVRTSYISPDSLEEVEIEVDPRSCSHLHLVVANARLTQEDGMALYAQILIECSECKDMWRLQHRFNEIAQLAGGSDRFLAPSEMGLLMREEEGMPFVNSLTKTDTVKETMRILRENNVRLPRKPPVRKKRAPRRKK